MVTITAVDSTALYVVCCTTDILVHLQLLILTVMFGMLEIVALSQLCVF